MSRCSTHKLSTSPALVSPTVRITSSASVVSGPQTPTEDDLKVNRSSSHRPSSTSIWFEIRRRLFRRLGHGSSSDSRSTCATSDSLSQQTQAASSPVDSPPSPFSPAASELVSSSAGTNSILNKRSEPAGCCIRTTMVQTCMPRPRVSAADSNSRSPRVRSHPYARPSGFFHDLSPVQSPLSAGDSDGRHLVQLNDDGKTSCKTTGTSPFPYCGDHCSELFSYTVVSTAAGSDSSVLPEGGPFARHSLHPRHHESKLRSSVTDSAPLLSTSVPLAAAGAPINRDSSLSGDNHPGGGLKRADAPLREDMSGSGSQKDCGEHPATSLGDYRLLRSLPGLVAHPRLRSYSTSCSLRSPRHAFRRDGRAATLVCDPMHIKRVTCNVLCEQAEGDPFAPDNSAFILSNDQQRQFLQSVNGVKLALLKLRRILKENVGHRHAFQDQLDSRSSTLRRNRLSGGTLTLDHSFATTASDYATFDQESTSSHVNGLLADELERRLRLPRFSQTFDAANSSDIEAPFSAPPSQESYDYFSFTAAQPSSSSRFLQSSGDYPPLPHTLEEALEEIVRLRTENAELKAKITHSDDVSR
uniref:Uncharacterized protein n=1 Tax=Schistocephalus solidus TaxID=70667 RepID=A0A0V0J4Z0_SCHSO